MSCYASRADPDVKRHVGYCYDKIAYQSQLLSTLHELGRLLILLGVLEPRHIIDGHPTDVIRKALLHLEDDYVEDHCEECVDQVLSLLLADLPSREFALIVAQQQSVWGHFKAASKDVIEDPHKLLDCSMNRQ